MNIVAHLVMIAWLPLVVAMFAMMPARRAVLVAFVGAWLFLPVVSYEISGLPDYTKTSATCAGVLLGVLLFDTKRLLSYRPSLIDLPMLLWCLCPILSSLENDLGLYDGCSESFKQMVAWALPYFIGRLYYSDLRGARSIATAIVLGGLIYVPLCLLEIRVSPQLHRWIYGAHQHAFIQQMRFDGFRPMVFMEHGLMVGMWMAGATLVGIWLWACGTVKRFLGMPFWVSLGVLFVTTVLCKAVYALLLLGLGLAGLMLTKWFRRSIAIFLFALMAPFLSLAVGVGVSTFAALSAFTATAGAFFQKNLAALWVVFILLIPPSYMIARGSDYWDGRNLTEAAADAFGADRAQSLQFRFDNETILADKALQRPWLGWGGWGRSRVRLNGRDVVITDGLWIITLGQNGIIGLSMLTLTLGLPLAVMLWKYPIRTWMTPEVGPAAVIALLVGLYAIDNLLNDMRNPMFLVALGATCGLALQPRLRRKRRAVAVVHRPAPAVAVVPA